MERTDNPLRRICVWTSLFLDKAWFYNFGLVIGLYLPLIMILYGPKVPFRRGKTGSQASVEPAILWGTSIKVLNSGSKFNCRLHFSPYIKGLLYLLIWALSLLIWCESIVQTTCVVNNVNVLSLNLEFGSWIGFNHNLLELWYIHTIRV